MSILCSTFTQSLLEAVCALSAFFKMAFKQPFLQRSWCAMEVIKSSLRKEQNKKSTWKKVSVKREPWGKRRKRYSKTLAHVQHCRKSKYIFCSVTDALEIHINQSEFWVRISCMGRTESIEILVILKVKSEISDTAKGHPNLSHLYTWSRNNKGRPEAVCSWWQRLVVICFWRQKKAVPKAVPLDELFSQFCHSS